jgi:hypothetical protein
MTLWAEIADDNYNTSHAVDTNSAASLVEEALAYLNGEKEVNADAINTLISSLDKKTGEDIKKALKDAGADENLNLAAELKALISEADNDTIVDNLVAANTAYKSSQATTDLDKLADALVAYEDAKANLTADQVDKAAAAYAQAKVTINGKATSSVSNDNIPVLNKEKFTDIAAQYALVSKWTDKTVAAYDKLNPVESQNKTLAEKIEAITTQYNEAKAHKDLIDALVAAKADYDSANTSQTAINALLSAYNDVLDDELDTENNGVAYKLLDGASTSSSGAFKDYKDAFDAAKTLADARVAKDGDVTALTVTTAQQGYAALSQAFDKAVTSYTLYVKKTNAASVAATWLTATTANSTADAVKLLDQADADGNKVLTVQDKGSEATSTAVAGQDSSLYTITVVSKNDVALIDTSKAGSLTVAGDSKWNISGVTAQTTCKQLADALNLDSDSTGAEIQIVDAGTLQPITDLTGTLATNAKVLVYSEYDLAINSTTATHTYTVTIDAPSGR